MSAEEELLSRAYLAYNGQDVDGLLLNRIRPIFGEYYRDPETADDLTGAEKQPEPPQHPEPVAAGGQRAAITQPGSTGLMSVDCFSGNEEVPCDLR